MNRTQNYPLLCACLTLLVVANPAQSQQDSGVNRPVYDADTAKLLSELVGLARRTVWGAGETARATYLAVRISQKGRAAVPYVRQRFLDATLPEDGFLCAAFVALHGDVQDQLRVRKELETSEDKRSWLRGIVGDEKAMTASLRSGARWRDIPSRLPITLRGRKLAVVCMRSGDPLVRRTGLYFGFWLRGDVYAKEIRRISLRDPDGLTKRYARYLYEVRRKLAGRG